MGPVAAVGGTGATLTWGTRARRSRAFAETEHNSAHSEFLLMDAWVYWALGGLVAGTVASVVFSDSRWLRIAIVGLLWFWGALCLNALTNVGRHLLTADEALLRKEVRYAEPHYATLQAATG